MFDLDDLREKITDFKEKSPLGFKIAVLFIALFFISLIILAFQGGAQKIVIDENEKIVPDAEILIPDSPDLEKNYFPSRKPEQKWNESEILNYFTPPDDSSMTNLERSNDSLVNDILGAAP